MSHRSRLPQVSLALPAEDYSAYLIAVRMLARKMGDAAPDVPTLLVHTLCRRDAAGLVEDYLEAVDWPVRTPGGRRGKQTPSGDRRRARRTRLPRLMSFPKVDPSRN